MGFRDSQNQYQYDSMKAMGVNLFWNGISKEELEFLKSKDIKLIPVNTKSGASLYQWIHYYCDAKWSEWEAEGTDDTTDASLERNKSLTTIETSQGKTYVKTKEYPFPPADTIIRGPYYIQENKYVVKITQGDELPVRYTAEYDLMLQYNPQYPHNSLTTYEMTEPICRLQVTTCKTKHNNRNWYIDSLHIIKDTLITRGSFNNLNTFQTFKLLYTLENVPRGYKITGYRNIKEDIEWSGETTKNIEFRVVWLGSQKYQLSVDKITVYDNRGKRMKNFLQDVVTQIDSEINVIKISPSYVNTVLGWHGIDEVMSIDNFEPIRMVSKILRTQHNLQLYLPMMGRWNGTWENDYTARNPFGTNKLSPWKVLKKRMLNDTINIHIWQNAYYLSPGSNQDPVTFPYSTWTDKENRVAILAFQYSNAKEMDNNFGVSILCSAQKYPPLAYFSDPPPSTILYNVNLALMFGAKYFDLYTYFARNCETCVDSPGTYTGMVNYNGSQYYFTNKWYMWRDKLKGRLNGLMGKTIKRLNPHPEVNPDKYLEKITFGRDYNFIQQIVNTDSCTFQITNGSGDAFDLGFFADSLGRDYFMLISRYYNSECNPTLRIYFKPSHFQPYRNLNLKNFITGGSITKTINQYLSVSMDKGDAVFYGVFPVVKYGGELIENDTIKTNTELKEDMWIKNNVHLVIERGRYYTVKDTITLEGTGFITGKGYLKIGQGGKVKINRWDKSVFKGREGNNPKIYWDRYPTLGTVIKYKIYRAKGTTQYDLIAELDSTKMEYLDLGTIILDNPGTSIWSDYYVRAEYRQAGSEIVIMSEQSNIIRYDEVDGGFEKRVIEGDNTVIEYRLEQNYPNPFNPKTIIRYSVGDNGKSHTVIKVYDIIGREVVELLNEEKESGEYEIELDANKYKLTSGVYIYKIQSGAFSEVKKLLIVK